MKRLIAFLLVLLLTLYTAFAAETPVSIAPMYREDGLLCVVNKSKRIKSAYEPQDLVKPNVPTRKKSLQDKILLRQEAAQQLEKMFAAAKREAGFTLYAVSGYRSYGIQQLNLRQKLESVGGNKHKALLTVAPPGSSEHQLGLAMDIQSSNFLNLNQNFADTAEGAWLRDNADRFGFILRYQKEWEDITGYAFEPWHFRYVGIAHAKAIKKLNIPLEYYCDALQTLPDYVVNGGSDVLLSGLVSDIRTGNTAVTIGLSGVPDEDAALRTATQRYLPQGVSYEAALWACYPTPRPTSAPRVDSDTEEISLFAPGGE